MLKNLAIVALSILILSVQADTQTNETQNTSNHTAPSLPTPPVAHQKEDSQPLQPKAETHVNADVRVIQTLPKDRYDIAAFWISVVLAGIGICGIVAGIVTILKLERQTKAAEDAAKSTLLNAKALINSERAWIMVETISPYTLNHLISLEDQIASGKPFSAVIEFRNYGNAPAWIIQSTAFLRRWNDEMFKSPLDYGNPPLFPNPFPVPPNGTERAAFKIRVEWEGGEFGSSADLRSMKQEGSYPLLYGFVKYKDPFPQEIRDEEPGILFCYRYDWDSSWWNPCGPAGVNKST